MRVRTEARRETILNTAAQVFMEMGYERASMAEIAARVGGSKATLYGYFPSKEELFMGVVLHKVGSKVEPAFRDLPSLAHEDPRRLLTQFGERFLSAILTPEAIGLKRLIIAHMTQSSVMERFWAEGPQKLIDSMETYLEAATTAGRLQVKEPKVAPETYKTNREPGGRCVFSGIRKTVARGGFVLPAYKIVRQKTWLSF